MIKMTSENIDTISSVLAKGTASLKNAGIESPRNEAELLLATAMEVDRKFLWSAPETPVGNATNRYYSLVEKRAAGCPYAYLAGKKEFLGRDFTITTDVFIPRPETELLVLEVFNFIQKTGNKTADVLDLGCGSGIIGISLLLECPGIRIVASDISSTTIDIARKNAKMY
ncbi:MAG: peptide chain release factor N(5)-glutamine methyltransferase, partial [Candidatus Eremiobacteraeota bacterium]|nr:peptide chain release factor N(5)-glutamine methyltransferase [Candidatus Eremiobacteraeota bacterium]